MCWCQVFEEFIRLLTAMSADLTEYWIVDIVANVRMLEALSDSAPGAFRRSSACCTGLVHLVREYLERAKLCARGILREMKLAANVLRELATRLLPAALHSVPLQTRQDLAESTCLTVKALLASVDKLDRMAVKRAHLASLSRDWKREAEPMLAASLHVLRCAPRTRHYVAAMRSCMHALCCCMRG